MDRKPDRFGLFTNIVCAVLCTALAAAVIVLCVIITTGNKSHQEKVSPTEPVSMLEIEAEKDRERDADNVNGQGHAEKEFYLIDEQGTIVIYELQGEEKKFYDYAAVETALMAEDIRLQLKNGLFINSIEELYEFLQTYSS